MNIMSVNDIVEANGKSFKDNNLAIQHNIPLGSLVEILPEQDENPNEPNRHTGLRLFVVSLSRDCDGTPLYTLSFNKNSFIDYTKYRGEIDNKQWDHEDPYAESILKWKYWSASAQLLSGFPEESLLLIN